MTLGARVSLFFLAALALVLASYSLLLYAIVRYYLFHQFDSQLQGAFNILVAAIEVEPDDVKFEPTDHTIRLGREADVEDIRWAIVDEQDRLVDKSENLAERDALPLVSAVGEQGSDGEPVNVGHWRVLHHRVAAEAPKPVAERDPSEREALVLAVARSSDDLHANLRRLGGATLVLPLVVWMAAALVGRWYCGRALAPVRKMAAEVRQMKGEQPAARLEVSSSGDEIADLGGAFNDLLGRLHAALQRQQRFSGDAAHQLRTPLTILQGHLEVALRRERTADDYRQTLALLHDEAAKLGKLVESLLFLARADAGQAPADWQTIDLTSWLSDYAAQWDGHPRRRDLTVQCEPSLLLPTSPDLLGQLLDNLVANAFKYSPPGTPVAIVAQRQSERVTIQVADQGMGIAPEDIAAVFEPFFRSQTARLSGASGAGLGLSIAKRLAESLAARLSCASKVAQGTVFSVDFEAPAAAGAS